MQVKIKKLTLTATKPTYETLEAAGFDIYSDETMVIYPGKTVPISTGLAMAIPPHYEVQIRPRSGMSLKTPLRIANAPGTIDSDYRGEVKILVYNIGDIPYTIQKGSRIAQGVLQKVPRAVFIEVETLNETERGEGRFGSTGV